MRTRIALLAAVLFGLLATSPARATVSVVLGSSDPDAIYHPGETITLTTRVTANGGEASFGAAGNILYPDAYLNVNPVLNTQFTLPGFANLVLDCNTTRCRAFNQAEPTRLPIAPNVTDFLISTTRFIIGPGTPFGTVIQFTWQSNPVSQQLFFFGVTSAPGYSVTVQDFYVPEPTTAALLGVGLLGVALASRRAP